MRVDPVQSLADRVSAGGRPVDRRAPERSTKHVGSWLRAALAVIWIGLLLFIVAYVTVNGEAAISEFDRLDLSAYSSSPP